MFYQLKERHSFNGVDQCLDIAGKAHEFLHSKTLGVLIRFQTSSPAYCTILALYNRESLLPDFSISINKGYLSITTRSQGRLLLLKDSVACNDGKEHLLVVNGRETGLEAWLDGRLAIQEEARPYCDYGYIGFASIGRGTLKEQFANYYEGDILELLLSKEPFQVKPQAGEAGELKKIPLFQKGMAGVENFRIPTMVTTPRGLVIASADARVDVPGDNPNHISRAVRISRDSGESWGDIKLLFDFGGIGKEDGAAAIDGQMVVDDQTGKVLMIYSHTPAGIGSALSQKGTGFDQKGRRILQGSDGASYYQEQDGTVTREDGTRTAYSVDAYDRLYQAGKAIGSVCHGEPGLHGETGWFRIMPTSFLQVVESQDDGETWSQPRDLNPQVKKPWMRFIGAGPGMGICISGGSRKGRLVCPVYFSNDQRLYSSSVIYSDDHGLTWNLGASVNDGRILDGKAVDAEHGSDGRAMLGECQLAQLPGGILRFFIRNPIFHRVITATSLDGGETWQQVEVEEMLPNPDCQCAVLRADQGGRDTYLFSGPDHESIRVKGTVWKSDDHMATWGKKKLLESGEFGYNSIAQMPDGSIGMLYEGLDCTIYFTKFSLDWLDED